MARIRSVKPETFTSFTLSRVPIETRFFFIGLWTEADDEGKLIDSAKLLAGSLFPHDDKVTAKRVEQWLCLLVSIDAIVRYEVDGAKYIQVKEWRHQKISHPGVSRIPNPSGNPPESFQNNSGDSPVILVPDLGSRIIGSRKREKKSPPAKPSDFDDDFSLCWEIVPKREVNGRYDSRTAAFKAYCARRREKISAEDLLLATQNYQKARQGEDQNFNMFAARFYGSNEEWKPYLAPVAQDTKSARFAPAVVPFGRPPEDIAV